MEMSVGKMNEMRAVSGIVCKHFAFDNWRDAFLRVVRRVEENGGSGSRNEVTTSENWVGRGVEMNYLGMMAAQHPNEAESRCLNTMRQNEKIEFAFSSNETRLRAVDQVLMKTV
jgi:hypothetical protein